MKKVMPYLGLVLLLVAFAFAAFKTQMRPLSRPADNVQVIRIGHWLIHAGMREGLDAIIADYQKLHPNVRVEQNTVPLKVWPAWQRSQWAGGTAPDLMQLGKGTGDRELGRYYQPLAGWIHEPNPYNAGTPLAGIPWRDTFVEGLSSSPAYIATLGENYGIPTQVNTTRLYYNRDLLREITGGDRPPATLGALLELGQKVRAYSERTGKKIVPLSLCGPYAEQLVDRVFAGTTQTLSMEFTPLRQLRGDGAMVSEAYLDGRWDFHRPAAHRALELWAQIAGLAQPGYMQLQREDAHFAFVTGGALMIFAGSWDYAGITQEARFEVGLAAFPFPAAGERPYGEFSLGPTSEAESGMEAIMGLSRDSTHPEIAMDFLRFLTSYESGKKLSAISRRIPAVIDVPVPAELAALRPEANGAVSGLSFRTLSGSTAAQVFNQNIHLLSANRPGDRGVDAFIDAIAQSYPQALRQDLARTVTSHQQSIRLADTRAMFAITAAKKSGGLDDAYETTLDQELTVNRIRSQNR